MSLDFNITDKAKLEEAREETHKAVQLVSMVPRCLLEPDPTDVSASLNWDKKLEMLVSQEVQGIVAGFEFADQILCLGKDGKEIERIQTVGNTYEQLFQKLKNALTDHGLNGEALRMDLPYDLPGPVERRGVPFQQQDPGALNVLSSLFSFTSSVLQNIFAPVEEASAVTCWPHHYDLATLLTLVPDEDFEKTKSIGFGFSPGDGNYDEPYFYLTPWPYPATHQLYTLKPPAFWNTEGWVGGVLKVADLKAYDAKQVVIDYFKEGFDKLKVIYE